ncbi:MAG: PilN domain-containing protein [Vicinamibacterales bacterium]
MIKINLIAANPGAVAPKVWLPREQRSALIGLTMLMSTAVGIAGFWYYQHAQGAALDTRTAAVQTELARLKIAAQLVDQTMAKRAELSERLGLIDRLRAAKRGPVSLLETVSRSVPDGLWLIEIKQTGMTVQVDGRAMSLTSITDFTERLQNSGLFLHPVEILTTTTEVVEETPVVRFSVKAESVPPAAPADHLAPSVPGTTASAPTRPLPGA